MSEKVNAGVAPSGVTVSMLLGTNSPTVQNIHGHDPQDEHWDDASVLTSASCKPDFHETDLIQKECRRHHRRIVPHDASCPLFEYFIPHGIDVTVVSGAVTVSNHQAVREYRTGIILNALRIVTNWQLATE